MPRTIYKYCCGAIYEATAGPCPTCHDERKVRAQQAHGVVDDTIVGGFWQEHFGNEPEYFESKKAMADRAKELGLMPFVRHRDGDPHTTRWV